ncbi:MAG: AAC(3) family N-acetyltransferase [Fluviicola sp.]
MSVVKLQGSVYDLSKQLDLSPSDTVFLASDITRLALIAKKQGEAFSADRFIESIQEVLSQGTLIVPAYTDHLKNGDTFNWNTDKPTTGALSNRVMRRKDFTRTEDPLHSVFVWGKGSEELLNLRDESTFGANSVFGFLERQQAKMIIIDVDYDHSFTYIHYLEEGWDVHYRRYKKWQMHMEKEGQLVSRSFLFHAKKMGVLTELGNYERSMRESGLAKSFALEDVPITLVPLEPVRVFTRSFLDQGGKLHRFSLTFLLKSVVKKFLRKA